MTDFSPSEAELRRQILVLVTEYAERLNDPHPLRLV